MDSRLRSLRIASPVVCTGMLLLGSGFAAPVLAQGLEEIIVTAQKKEESLQDVPISLIAYGSEDLVNLGVSRTQDISDTTPNLVMPNVGVSTAEVSVAIRGVVGAEISTIVDSKVATYIDGVYVGKNSGAVFNMPNLERIEVLRGPQGTLFGRNSAGGALNVTTKTPYSAWGVQQDFTVGNDGIFQSKSYVQIPITETLAAGISYVKAEDDGHFKNTHPGARKNLGSEASDAWRARFHWDATDNLVVDYGYDHYDGESMPRPVQLSYFIEGLDTLPVLGGGPNPYAEAVAAGAVQFDRRIDKFNLNFTDKFFLKVKGHNLTLDWSVTDDIRVKSITGYRETEQLMRAAQIDGGAWTIPLSYNAKDRRTEHEQFSQEFQLIGSGLNGDLEYVVGLYYFDEEGFDNEGEGRRLTLAIPTPATATALMPFATGAQQVDFAATSKAAYGQVSYTPDVLDGRLTFTVGLRHTRDESEISKNGESFSPPMVGRLETSKEWTNTSGLFVVDYAINADTMVFFKAAEGYSAGVLPFRASSPTVFQNNAAAPETLLDLEVGIKSSFMSNRVRVNATAFQYDYKDIHVNDSILGNPIVTNGGSATSRGVELELTAILMEGLQVNLNYGYLDSSYDELLLITSADTQGNILGYSDLKDSATPGFSPRNSGSAIVQYTRPVFGWAELSAFLNVTYTDEYHASPRSSRNHVEAHTLINARFGLGKIRVGEGELSFAVWGKNLADKEYRTFGSDFSDSLGFAYNQWGRPRTYGLDVSYSYF